jgi:hypothetical protein
MSNVKVTAEESVQLIKLFEAWQELKKLGWIEPHYFHWPPAHTEFEVIELGSTGIHRAVKFSPDVSDCAWVDRDWPSNPFLVREVKNEKQ